MKCGLHILTTRYISFTFVFKSAAVQNTLQCSKSHRKPLNLWNKFQKEMQTDDTASGNVSHTNHWSNAAFSWHMMRQHFSLSDQQLFSRMIRKLINTWCLVPDIRLQDSPSTSSNLTSVEELLCLLELVAQLVVNVLSVMFDQRLLKQPKVHDHTSALRVCPTISGC